MNERSNNTKNKKKINRKWETKNFLTNLNDKWKFLFLSLPMCGYIISYAYFEICNHIYIYNNNGKTSKKKGKRKVKRDMYVHESHMLFIKYSFIIKSLNSFIILFYWKYSLTYIIIIKAFKKVLFIYGRVI